MKANQAGRAWIVAGLTIIAVLGFVVSPVGSAIHPHPGPQGGVGESASSVAPAYSVSPPGAGGVSVLDTVGFAFNETVLGNVSYLTVNEPNAVVFDPENNMLYVSGDTPFIAALSASSYQAVKILPSGSGTPPGGLVYSPATHDVYA